MVKDVAEKKLKAYTFHETTLQTVSSNKHVTLALLVLRKRPVWLSCFHYNTWVRHYNNKQLNQSSFYCLHLDPKNESV